MFRVKGTIRWGMLNGKQGSLEAETRWRMTTSTLKEIGRNVGLKSKKNVEMSEPVRQVSFTFLMFSSLL